MGRSKMDTNGKIIKIKRNSLIYIIDYQKKKIERERTDRQNEKYPRGFDSHLKTIWLLEI